MAGCDTRPDRRDPCTGAGEHDLPACLQSGGMLREYDNFSGPVPAKGTMPKAQEACYRLARECSYADERSAGFLGGAADGPLTIGVEGSNLFQCLILVSEPGFGWTKPLEFANWNNELKVTVNGKPCAAPECSIHAVSTGFSQLWVDARAALGGTCRRQTIKVGIEVAPLSSKSLMAKAGVCERKPNRQCEFGGDWRGYAGNYCEEDGKGGCRASQKLAGAWEKRRARALVSTVVAF